MDTPLLLIKDQLQSADEWTAMLVDDLEKELWLESPAPLNTNINWLVGHILISKYFHAVVCTVGEQPELKKLFPLDDYISIYNRKSDPLKKVARKPAKDTLLDHLHSTDRYTLDVVDRLDEAALTHPTRVTNPVATTQLDALTYCFKHQMWHNGQISMLKRILTTNY